MKKTTLSKVVFFIAIMLMLYTFNISCNKPQQQGTTSGQDTSYSSAYTKEPNSTATISSLGSITEKQLLSEPVVSLVGIQKNLKTSLAQMEQNLAIVTAVNKKLCDLYKQKSNSCKVATRLYSVGDTDDSGTSCKATVASKISIDFTATMTNKFQLIANGKYLSNTFVNGKTAITFTPRPGTSLNETGPLWSQVYSLYLMPLPKGTEIENYKQYKTKNPPKISVDGTTILSHWSQPKINGYFKNGVPTALLAYIPDLVTETQQCAVSLKDLNEITTQAKGAVTSTIQDDLKDVGQSIKEGGVTNFAAIPADTPQNRKSYADTIIQMQAKVNTYTNSLNTQDSLEGDLKTALLSIGSKTSCKQGEAINSLRIAITGSGSVTHAIGETNSQYLSTPGCNKGTNNIIIKLGPNLSFTVNQAKQAVISSTAAFPGWPAPPEHLKNKTIGDFQSITITKQGLCYDSVPGHKLTGWKGLGSGKNYYATKAFNNVQFSAVYIYINGSQVYSLDGLTVNLGTTTLKQSWAIPAVQTNTTYIKEVLQNVNCAEDS